MMRLGDVVTVQPKSKVKAGDGLNYGKYKFFTSSNIQSKWINEYQYDKPALIFGTGGIPSIHYCDTPFSTSTDCLVVYAKTNVSLAMIYTYLSSNMHILEKGFRGVGLKHISKDYILNLQIPEIDEETQLQIVKIAEKLSTIIRFRKQQLSKLDELVKARFVEMFGDPEFNDIGLPTVLLSEVCSVGSSKRIYQNELSSTGVPFLRISDLVYKIDIGILEAELYIPKAKFTELKNSSLVPEPGDILVTSRGTLGRCYIVKDTDEFYFQDGMISWLSNFSDDITPLYLAYLFSIEGFKKQIDNLQAGSTVAYLSIAMLKKLKVMLPSIELQHQFAAFVEQVNKSKFEIQKSLEKLETLKKALMQKYFG